MIKSYPERLSPKAFYLEDNITNSFTTSTPCFFLIKAELGLSYLKKSTYKVLPIVLSGV